MTSPTENEQDTAYVGSAAGPPASAQEPEDVGPVDPPAHDSQGVAGEAQELPQQLSRDEVFSILSRATTELEQSGALTLAAAVGSKMRQVDSRFTQRASGYKTFRRLLDDAQSAGVIHLSETTDASDVRVSVGPSTSVEPASPAPLPQIRGDLWKAFLDWNPSSRYAFHRSTKSTTRVSGPVADDDAIQVTSVSQSLQQEWMRDFAREHESPEASMALNDALSGPSPVFAFSQVLRDHVSTARAWKKFLRARVIERIAAWAETNAIAPTDLQEPYRSEAVEEKVDVVGTPDALAAWAAGEGDVRDRILGILALMPTSELLRLPIPVEYALRR